MKPDAERPLLSVVVTNYNYSQFVADAIESALAQGDAAEVIVVDDGSTDGSRDVIAGFAGRVSTVFQENDGQAAAFNSGYRASTGSVVLFLDADDLLEPAVVSDLRAAFASGPVHVCWQLRLADARGLPGAELRPPRPGLTGDLRDEIAARGPGFLPVTPTSGNAYARAFLETALPMPTAPYRNGGGDLYLSWLAAASGPVSTVARPLSRYRRHGTNDNISGSTDERIDRGLAWARGGLLAVADRLGLDAGVIDGWAADEWWHQADAARSAVRRHVPADTAVLVVDGHLWALRGTFAGRPVVQLMADYDDGLVAQTRRAVASGTGHLVVASFCRWWFEHFPRWASWVRDHAAAVHDEPGATVIVFGSA